MTIENKNYNEKFNQYTSDDQFKHRPDTWSGKEDEWNNKKIDAQKLLYEVLEPQKEKTKKYCQEIEYISIKHKDDELTEAKVARNKLNF